MSGYQCWGEARWERGLFKKGLLQGYIKPYAYFKCITSKDLLDSTGSSAQYSVITLWFPGGRMGEGIVREFGMDMDTLLCLTWRTNKDLLDSTGSSAPCHAVAWMGGESGGEGIRVYGWLNPFAVHLKSSQLC